ncbi:MAG: glycosyltransferase family 4 protein [Vicingus serpentipes]|nr:glycosyltransferase family 4 protein [Vicingus serpentipes]
MSVKPTILILGKLPPPLIGPAIATQIILNSKLKEAFQLVHLDTRMNKEVATMGRWSFSKMIRSVVIYFEFISLVRKHQPQIILVPISQTTMGFLKDALFIWLGKWMGKKVLIQLRGSNFKNWLNGTSSFVTSLVKITLKKCVGVIVLGHNLKHLFADYFNEEQIFVVPNGANYNLETKKEEELTILYLANFLPAKSFDDILKAIIFLKEKGIANFKLKAAGAWDNEHFKTTCLALIEEHQLVNVELLPPQSGREKMQLFADADIFVFCPKMPEGHPWVIVEAMANSLPIIATDQGAIIESVMDGENGFIVSPEQPDTIAEKLELLLKDEALRKQMAAKSKEYYQANFTEEKMVQNLGGVFRKVLD